jgi:hypothetical protein
MRFALGDFVASAIRDVFSHDIPSGITRPCTRRIGGRGSCSTKRLPKVDWQPNWRKWGLPGVKWVRAIYLTGSGVEATLCGTLVRDWRGRWSSAKPATRWVDLIKMLPPGVSLEIDDYLLKPID